MKSWHSNAHMCVQTINATDAEQKNTNTCNWNVCTIEQLKYKLQPTPVHMWLTS